MSDECWLVTAVDRLKKEITVSVQKRPPQSGFEAMQRVEEEKLRLKRNHFEEMLKTMDKVVIKDPAAGSGAFLKEIEQIFGGTHELPQTAAGRLALLEEMASMASDEDVEDADLVDRCEQLEKELAHAQQTIRGQEMDIRALAHQNATLRSAPLGHASMADYRALEAQLADARDALRIERANVDRLTPISYRETSLRYAVEKRLTMQNHVVECAMRYVKVQSARYQRELLAAIDELERCPK